MGLVCFGRSPNVNIIEMYKLIGIDVETKNEQFSKPQKFRVTLKIFIILTRENELITFSQAEILIFSFKHGNLTQMFVGMVVGYDKLLKYFYGDWKICNWIWKSRLWIITINYISFSKSTIRHDYSSRTGLSSCMKN